MKIKEITYKGEHGNDCRIKIEVDGKSRFDIGEGEPEDMVLWRDLSDAYDVASLMEEAYNAGKAGEEFEFETEEQE